MTDFNIIWIRHAFSCANFIHQFPNKKAIALEKSINVTDPLVTAIGFEHAQKIFPTIIKRLLQNFHLNPKQILPIFFTSILQRTIQTAIAFNPKIPRIILPYVNEVNSDLFIKEIAKKSHITKKYKTKTLPNLSPYRNNKARAFKPTPQNFFANVFPVLYEYAQKHNKNTIFIISHGTYIYNITGLTVDNVGTIVQKLKVYPDEGVETIKSTMVYTGYTPDNITDINDPKVAPCFNHHK